MRPVSRVSTGLFILLLFGSAYIYHPVDYDNTASRFYLLSAAVDFGRLDIDMYKDQTIDISVANGRTYSNKAIGLPLIAAPVYWFLRNATPVQRDQPLSQRARYICNAFTTSVSFGVAGVVLLRLLMSFGISPLNAMLSVIAYAFGTIAWIHASMFSGHQMAASLSLMSFAAVRSGSAGGRAAPVWFLGGLMAGLAGLCDYTAIFLAGALMIYAVAKSRSPSQWAAFAAGGAVNAIVLMAYNNHCFGGPFSFSYANLGYTEFAEGSSRGLLGVALPDFHALISLIVSPARGLFFIMPVMLAAIPGAIAMRRLSARKNSPFAAAEFRVIALIIAGYLVINAGFYGWHGGWTFGPRYLTPMLPFLAIWAAFALDMPWFIALLALSVTQVGLAQISMPHAPEEILNPIVECLIPLFRMGYQSESVGGIAGWSGGWAFIPLFVFLIAIGVALIRAAARDSGPDPAPRSADWRPLYAFAMVSIIITLIAVRTPDRRIPPFLRARLLGNLAYVQNSPELARRAVEEQARSGLRF